MAKETAALDFYQRFQSLQTHQDTYDNLIKVSITALHCTQPRITPFSPSAPAGPNSLLRASRDRPKE